VEIKYSNPQKAHT